MRLVILYFILFSSAAYAQTFSIDWTERRAAEINKSPYISRIIEYKPAPGQFINELSIGTPEAAQSVVGGVRGLVSLGGFGGYIVVGFDHTIMNDPANPYGVDFTVVGNAAANSSEPGIVMVMADTNGNGLPDDIWYELKGSHYDSTSTIRKYTITYMNPGTNIATDIPWTDDLGKSGVLKRVATHTQPYYPLPDLFPDYPQEKVSFTGTLIDMNIYDDNPQYVRIPSLPYGYADNLPFRGGNPPYFPDDPSTFNVLEGNGGNAFDISWAVDDNGNPVHLDGIDFIKIYTAVNVNAGWLGEISTELCGIIDVSPDDVLPDDVLAVPDFDHQSNILVYPNPAIEYVKVQAKNKGLITRVEIWNASGKLFYVNALMNSDSISIPVGNFPTGVYLICVYEEKCKTVRKISITP